MELSQLATEVVLLFQRHIFVKNKAFSALTANESKHRNRLQLETDLRVAVSTSQPTLSHRCSSKHASPTFPLSA
jgi:hypothetical protein